MKYLKGRVLSDITVLGYVFVMLHMCDVFSGFFETLFIIIFTATICIIHIKCVNVIFDKKRKNAEMTNAHPKEAGVSQTKRHTVNYRWCYIVFFLLGAILEAEYRLRGIWFLGLISNLFEALGICSIPKILNGFRNRKGTQVDSKDGNANL